MLVHDQRVSASKVWVRLTDEDFSRLTGKVADTIDLPTFGSIRAQAQISPTELWQQVADGRYVAFRVRNGQTWQWHLKEVRPATLHNRSQTVRRGRKGDTPYE